MATRPANIYEQAQVHNDHAKLLIYLLKKYLYGDVVILREDIDKVVEENDSFNVRPLSSVVRLFVDKMKPDQIHNVTYIETTEDKDAPQIENPDTP